MESEYVDFNTISSDPKQIELVKKYLNADIKRKNTMTISEFRGYSPLFNIEDSKLATDEQLSILVTQWSQRVSIYDPVYIVDSDNKLMYTLPPIFNKLDIIKNNDIINGFTMANDKPDEFGIKRNKWANIFTRAFEAAQNESKLYDNKVYAQELANKIESQQPINVIAENGSTVDENGYTDMGDSNIGMGNDEEEIL